MSDDENITQSSGSDPNPRRTFKINTAEAEYKAKQKNAYWEFMKGSYKDFKTICENAVLKMNPISGIIYLVWNTAKLLWRVIYNSCAYFGDPPRKPPIPPLEGEGAVSEANPNWSDAENITMLEKSSINAYLHEYDDATIRDKRLNSRGAQEELFATFPPQENSVLDHLPLDMQKTKDENLAIYGNAYAANRAAIESPGYAQAATRDRLLENREQRESDMQSIQSLPHNFQEERASRQILLDQLEAMQESKLNQAEQDSPPARPTPAPYTPPIGTEVIDPVEYLRNARENPLSYTPVAFREHARYIPTAAWAAQSAPSATSAPQGGVKVTIERILPPPTHLADEDFRRCMQREIDQIIETFDTGVRG